MLQQPTPVAPATLFHVEDSPIWVELVEASIRPWPEVRYTGFAPTLRQAKESYRSQPPTLLLLDLQLPDGNALEWAEELRRARARTKIILCTARVDEVALHCFDRLMLDGMLWKEFSLARALREAIATVLVGGRHFPPELMEARRRLRVDPNAWFKLLSDREQELLPLLGQGQTDAEVGRAMRLSPETIHSHRRNIMRKLGLHRSVELIHWAQKAGFVLPPMVSSLYSHRNR
jgi:DNA-binding NarL/FixJ family response regulator